MVGSGVDLLVLGTSSSVLGVVFVVLVGSVVERFPVVARFSVVAVWVVFHVLHSLGFPKILSPTHQTEVRDAAGGFSSGSPSFGPELKDPGKSGE